MTDTAESTQKIALVTGASRGIGAATALALAQAGYHLILTGRSEQHLAEVEGKIHGAGGTATIAPFDLADSDAIDRLAAAIGARWGRLDLLVLNAGQLGTLAPLPHIEVKEWNSVINLNLTANWRLVRAFDPWLRQSPTADVVALTSTVGHEPRAYWGAYAVSKAALESMIAIYGLEVEAITGIRTHVVNPGATRTAMRARAFPGEDPQTVKPPEDVAAMILAVLPR
ncbi:SDR family NAD(P)-dependent oxidoreductase [Polymorphobacter fuscus]|uniref:SDR family NAD(P)-dependent oxidoreductase n=1 Tax=Sandarakinorhabdus fusca TaxID=1439888 RepID=A0A7C9KYF7_9SPHN|nr:SDR family NAD(P)-dependent oxidoreductase [Polymorphobacter fuscus]KAB7644369.1 SDR family NAD(P)-dependent oxidoreductase [Polymorphobacter fuscus]MQT18286.1 SDR family NAD(P)-dependent oxidoreductase [Polymorphobacter fuscus]NJC08180.1 NAD(P)-dependent dehydrogenase (short-subunit alcohol dehydrogenase family) [Polymorphobacter fuscus]